METAGFRFMFAFGKRFIEERAFFCLCVQNRLDGSFYY